MTEKETEQDYIVYTDGGCAVNPTGPGGIAVVIIDTNTGEITEISKGYNCTTNNRMEIMVVITAAEFIKEGTVSLYSDSQYVLNTLSGKFRKKQNQDLWKKLDDVSRNIQFDLHWIKGHSGDHYNEQCDRMCQEAMYDLEHMEEDAGYIEIRRSRKEFMENVSNQAAKPENSMHKQIELPEKFNLEQIHLMPAKEYAKLYQTSETCAKKLFEFKMYGSTTFQAYMGLKSGNDSWSRKKKEALLEGLPDPDEIWQIVTSYIPEESDAFVCLRWYRRGLPLYHAIRKTLVAIEIRNNCYKS